MATLYTKELEAAIRAMRFATKSLLPSEDKGTRPKADHSPVTIADYAAQALLIAAVHHGFPDDHFLGEESATELRRNPAPCDQVWNLISATVDQNADAGVILGDKLKGKDDMLRYIDLGGEGMGSPESRVWMLDPLDGTAVFMSGGSMGFVLLSSRMGSRRSAL